ncbi:aromatic-ring hydroxylase C-terminal domain-containing protein [Streptomyces sp. NPDC004393]
MLAQASGDDDRLAPVRDLLSELAESADTAGPLAETITGVGTRCPASGDPVHPWAGRAVPDIPLGQDGEDSLTALLTRMAGGALLLNDAADSQALSAVARPWAGRVATAYAHPHALERARAILVRPDGHAAWIGAPSTPVDAAADELRETLARWFGRPAPTP